MGTGPHQVPVSKRVRRAVESRGLAVPDRENTVLRMVGLAHRQLATGDGCGRQLFVQSGAMDDAQTCQQFGAARKFQIEAGERRTRIARDKTARVQPRLEIRSPLVHGQANDGLHAGQQGTTFFHSITVGESHIRQRRSR